MMNARRALLPCSSLLLLLTVFACRDSGGPPAVPARLEPVQVQRFSATVAAPVAPVPAVTVRDRNGRGIANVTVHFSASDGGVVGMSSVRTDAEGRASAGSWILGIRAGVQTLTATVAGLPVITFEAAAGADAPVSATANTTPLDGIAGGTIPVPDVRVSDQYGNGVAAVAVQYRITSDAGGSVAAVALTDSTGVARAGGWTLSAVAGINTIEATVPGIAAAPIVFVAHGSAGPPVRLALSEYSGFAQSGIPLDSLAVIQVVDEHGNALATSGVQVRAEMQSDSAALDATVAVTGTDGGAVFSDVTITGRAGRHLLRFSAPGLSPAEFNVLLSGGRAHRLEFITAASANVVARVQFPVQPVVEVRDAQDNVATEHPAAVAVSVESGDGTLSGNQSAALVDGRATFTDLAFTGTGTFRLRFTTGTLPPLISDPISSVAETTCEPATTLTLDYALGQTTRFRTDSVHTPRCLLFDHTRNGGQQYLVMFEHMPRLGSFGTGLFPGVAPLTDFIGGMSTSGPSDTATATPLRTMALPRGELPGTLHSWDFGGQSIYELQPRTPLHLVTKPHFRSGSGDAINANVAAPAVGDTVIAMLEGIPHLGIAAGPQKAVVRHISGQLVFAEDVRLTTTLRRQSGGFNRPLTIAEMDSIAELYAAEPVRQSDRLFDGAYNSTTEALGGYIIAVHTLMPADNVWGYTYPNSNYLAFDFWVTSDGQTKGVNQSAVRLAHNLFMHEIAHMRHWALLERAGRTSAWGNRWLTEGFARFTERLPIASYLLQQEEPSRTANFVLGSYAGIQPPSYEDVPVYFYMGAQVTAGYAASSYIFDYLADQVAADGRDWKAALRDFVVHANDETLLDGRTGALLPGTTALGLITRARIALYLDDIGIPGLPLSTQYLQYDLRGSRPPGVNAAADPRNAWPHIAPGSSFSQRIRLPGGAAYGYLIDGTHATTSASIQLEATAGSHGVVSITRIR